MQARRLMLGRMISGLYTGLLVVSAMFGCGSSNSSLALGDSGLMTDDGATISDTEIYEGNAPSCSDPTCVAQCSSAGGAASCPSGSCACTCTIQSCRQYCEGNGMQATGCVAGNVGPPSCICY